MAVENCAWGPTCWLARMVRLGVLCAAACTGTEHAVFHALPQQTTVLPPSHPRREPSDDAGSEPPIVIRRPLHEDDAGSVPDPDLDRTVVFGWKESLPGQGTCHAGRYVGVFTCMVAPGAMADPTQSPTTLSGAVTFTLAGSQEQQVLSITQGQFSGSLFYAPSLTGKLDCIAKRFEAMTMGGFALVRDGAGGNGASGPTLFPTFSAMFDGRFDDQSLVIRGSFVMVNDAGQVCSGTFRASAAP